MHLLQSFTSFEHHTDRRYSSLDVLIQVGMRSIVLVTQKTTTAGALKSQYASN